MRRRYKTAFILISLSLITALLRAPVSGAISHEKLDRTVAASVTGDSNGALQLNGFDGQNYKLDGSYDYIGTITNNINETLVLTISFTVDFSAVTNKNCWLGLKAGNASAQIRYSDTPTGQLTVTLGPGKAQDIYAKLQQNQNKTVAVSLDFAASDTNGAYFVQLADTPDSPRKVYLY